MRVKVVPIYPIRGVLPKNKCIDVEMELDLNKSEILCCMQSANVYDENGNILDRSSLNKIDFNKVKIAKPEEKIINNIPKMPRQATVGTPILPRDNNNQNKKISTEYYHLSSKYSKEENYYILEVTFHIDYEGVDKVSGNVYGLFNLINGTKRPNILEYKANDNWSKFNAKFANFDVLTDGDKFVFRLTPNTNSQEFNYKITLKDGSNELVSLTDKINFGE